MLTFKVAERAHVVGDSARADTDFATAPEAEVKLTTETDTIVRILEEAHQENASRICYNNENALTCVVTYALYTVVKNDVLIRAMPISTPLSQYRRSQSIR